MMITTGTAIIVALLFFMSLALTLTLVLYKDMFKHTGILDYGIEFKFKKLKEIKDTTGRLIGYKWFLSKEVLPVIPPAGKRGRGMLFEYYISPTGEPLKMTYKTKTLDWKNIISKDKPDQPIEEQKGKHRLAFIKNCIKGWRFALSTKTVERTFQLLEAMPIIRKIDPKIIEMVDQNSIVKFELDKAMSSINKTYDDPLSTTKALMIIGTVGFVLTFLIGGTFFMMSQGMTEWADKAEYVAGVQEKVSADNLETMKMLERTGVLEAAADQLKTSQPTTAPPG